MSERKFWWEGIVLAALLGLVGIYLYGAGERPLEPSAVSAASELWQDIEAGELPHTTAAVRRIHPANARFLTLDTAAMHRILDQAPAEDARMGVLLSLPLPDGRSATFRVRQVPVMAPELAAEFPSFGTYAAVGVDDPAAVGRLDWTAHGFHAMITAPGGTVYIDPVAAGDVTHYQSYLRRDFFRTADPQSIPPDEVVADDKLRAELAALTAAYVRTRAARPTGEELRTYRLAVAATGEYTQFHGGTVADGLAAIVTAINRVNGIYERDAAVRMVLVGNNDQIIYTNGSTDPYTNNSGGTMLGQNQANLDSVIGSANYDIGHVFSTGGGGIAGLAVTCENGRKGYGVTGLPSPIGDPFYVDYVSHEIGHQFGGTHTMNGNEGACGGSRTGTTAYEPGSGSTIMAYAGICGSQNLQNNSDDHFHAASVDQMVAFTTQGGGNSCAQIINTGNTPPTADAGENFTIPADTPFMLSGTGADAEASAGLTYNWEELDLGPAGPPDVSTSPPYFRSWPSQTDGTRVFPRLTDLINNTTAVGEVLPTASDELVFRLTVRDNQADGGGVTGDEMAVTVTDAAGPFRVQAPNTAVSWTVGGVQTVNWAVAATTGAPINCTAVDIDLSADGGLTYPFNLVSAVANDGSHPVLVPNAETTAARVRVSCADNIFFDISDVDFTIAAPTESTFSLTVDPSNRQVCRPQPAVYTVQTEPLLGFNEPIDLSVTGIPAGATADFEPLTVTPGVSSTLTVSDTGAALTGDYGLTITAGAATVTRTAGVSLTLLPETIAPATLSSPADGATGLDPTVAFSWTAVAEADTYLFELSTGAAFDMADVVYTQMTAGTGVTVPQTAVDYGTRYYWRVTAETPCGPAVADASTFTTRSAPGACGPATSR